MNGARHIALIGNAAATMVAFRGPLIAALSGAGHRVSAICPPGSAADAAALQALGARHIPLAALSPGGIAPAAELAALRELTQILRDARPDIVFCYFLKPLIWGAIAARRAGVARVTGMIEGMGYAFSHPPAGAAGRARQLLARGALLALLRPALARLDALIVLNPADRDLARRRGGIAPQKLHLIDGIGVDLAHFSPAPLSDGPPRFVLAARLIREKGIAEFLAAARALEGQARFRLLGAPDAARGAALAADLAAARRRGLIEWPGHVADIRPHLRDSSVFVLPTLYREGLPRSVMEAMAMGRPIITTDMPGARDAVTDGQSGLVVQAGDRPALIAACRRFITHPGLAASMGAAARSEALRRYDLHRSTALQAAVVLGDGDFGKRCVAL